MQFCFDCYLEFANHSYDLKKLLWVTKKIIIKSNQKLIFKSTCVLEEFFYNQT